jgi:hypothetical protein
MELVISMGSWVKLVYIAGRKRERGRKCIVQGCVTRIFAYKKFPLHTLKFCFLCTGRQAVRPKITGILVFETTKTNNSRYKQNTKK